MDWLAIGIGAVVAVLVLSMFLLGRRLPYAFEHEGARYRRLPSGAFTDADRRPVTDPAEIAMLQATYDRLKNGDGELKGWSNSD